MAVVAAPPAPVDVVGSGIVDAVEHKGVARVGRIAAVENRPSVLQFVDEQAVPFGIGEDAAVQVGGEVGIGEIAGGSAGCIPAVCARPVFAVVAHHARRAHMEAEFGEFVFIFGRGRCRSHDREVVGLGREIHRDMILAFIRVVDAPARNGVAVIVHNL